MNKKQVLIALAILVMLGVALEYGLRESQRGETGNRVSQREQPGSAPTNAVNPSSPTDAVDLADGQTYDLTITPVERTIAGRTVKMLAYNGLIPGPTLRIPEGATVTINLKNGGDMPTTLHSHGVRMDNAFDGVPDVTQKAIAPGESFAYTLKFPDPGIFWYHPHVRTDYALESGLYGNFIVTPTDPTYWSPVNREVTLMLDDIDLDKNGLVPFDRNAADHTLMGRFGNVMLVNGEEAFMPQAKQGEVVRLYLTNGANSRLFNFAIPGVRMKLVGADMGRYEREAFVDEVLVAPGERRVVDVYFEKPGEYTLINKTPGKQYPLEKVIVSNESVAMSYAKEFETLRTNTAVADELNNLQEAYLDKTPDKRLTLTLDMGSQLRDQLNQEGNHMGGGHMMDNGMMMSGADMGMGDDGDAYEWEDTMASMNTVSNSNMMQWKLVDAATGKANAAIDDWKFKQGDKVKIRIFNDPKSMHPMQHPIHFHGQRFLVLSTNGVKNPNPVWQDTTLIAKGDTVDILLDASNPGTWMAHCHILEHAESGMMLSFTVAKAE